MSSERSIEPERPNILLIGDSNHGEFQQAVEWLNRHVRLDAVGTVDAALALWRRHGECWQTIVLAQARRGQFRQQDIQRINQAMPLARLIALLGSWCEGESRSGNPWPGVVRVYWHQWIARCMSSLGPANRPTAWQLPRTVSPIEETAHLMADPVPRGDGLLAIVTRRGTFFDALAAACAPAGYATVWLPSAKPHRTLGADGVLWDHQPARGAGPEQLRNLVARFAPVPVVALMGFPRLDDVHQAEACGVARVVSSPFQLPDLWNVLARVTTGAKQRHAENDHEPSPEGSFDTKNP